MGAVLEGPPVNLLVVERQNQVGILEAGVLEAIHGAVGVLSTPCLWSVLPNLLEKR